MAGHGHAAEVTIKDFSFQPGAVEVAAGQVVSWTNEDGEPHTVRSEDGSISSPIVGATPFEWTARGKPGSEIPYVCSIHPEMKGSVIIR
jgi:plastocyanin